MGGETNKMRKCFSCKETKNLKSIFIEDCDCHFDSFEKPEYHSVCRHCFFETCACDYDKHLSYECLEDETCENHEQTKKYDTNWNDYDYHWNLKVKVTA